MIALLVALWVCALLVVGVRGEFPENDSWAYARATEHFIRTGRVVRLEWTYAPVITNVIVGGIFAKLFGMSFAVLRLSSVVMGGLGMLGVYALCRGLHCGPARSALTAAAFAFCPLHFGLSYTFMTDVPYTTLATFSLVALCAGLRLKRWWPVVAGVALAVAAALSRQTGVVLIVALLATLALARMRTRRDFVIVSLAGLGLALLATLVERVLMGWSNFGVLRALTSAVLGGTPVYSFASHAVPSLFCLGLAGFPLLVAFAVERRFTRAELIGGACIALVSLAFVLVKLRHKPFYGNILDESGLGPIIVHCASQRPMVPGSIWWSLVGLGAASGGLSLYLIGAWVLHVAWPARRERPDLLLLPIGVALYLVPVFLRNPYFNRYLLPVMPAWLAVLALSRGAEAFRSQARLAGSGALAIVAMASMAVTVDYLGNLGVRHALVAPLLANGTNPGEIEAGAEFDGYYRYDRPGVKNTATDTENNWLRDRGTELIKSTAVWPHPEHYLVSYCREVPGYRQVKSEARTRFVPPTVDRLFLLERVKPAAP